MWTNWSIPDRTTQVWEIQILLAWYLIHELRRVLNSKRNALQIYELIKLDKGESNNTTARLQNERPADDNKEQECKVTKQSPEMGFELVTASYN